MWFYCFLTAISWLVNNRYLASVVCWQCNSAILHYQTETNSVKSLYLNLDLFTLKLLISLDQPLNASR